MKIKVLMVYPKIPTTYWSIKYTLPFINKKAALPPLGLLTVAALLPDNYESKLIDMNISDLSNRDLEKADIIFISAMIIQRESFKQVVQMCNQIGKPIVAGGPYPISSHDKISGVDHFVLDEAEVTLPLFLKDYESGTLKKIYTDKTKPDITKTPIPRLDLINVNKYLNLALQFSRGCPFNCEFCDIIEMFGRKPRTKNPEQFLKELDAVKKTGFRGSIFIVDDNFIGNKNKVKELLRHIIRWQNKNKFPFQFFTEASINLAEDDELLELMKQVGFDMVFIGIETPNEETLKAIQKTHNMKINMLEGIKKIQQKRIAVSAGFILGFDTDTEDIFERQIEFIEKAGITMAMIGILAAMPNTQLYRRLKKEKRLLNDWTGNNTHNLEMNFIPKIPEEKLVKGYKKVIRSIYSPKSYFNRCLTFLERIPVKANAPRPFKLIYFMTFFRSLIVQTFSFYGREYLRFLWKGIRINFRLIPEIIILAIYGHHFIKFTKEI